MINESILSLIASKQQFQVSSLKLMTSKTILRLPLNLQWTQNDASNDLTQAAWQSEQLLSGFAVVVDSSYVTHAPSFVLSSKPTTSLPSASPSLTGAIANIEISRMVTESISPEEIVSIQDEVAESYGVESDDITIDIVYETTGSIAIEIIEDTLTDEQLEEAIEDEISALLRIHEGNVAVAIEDGVARYTNYIVTVQTLRKIT
eukprot:UN03014